MNARFELTKEQKSHATDEIKRYFDKERDEKLGDLAAMLVFDFICEKFGPYFYNLGVQDAGKFLTERIEDLYGIEK